MKINIFTKTSVIAIIIIATMITACKKDNSYNNNNNNNNGNNNGNGQQVNDDSAASVLSGSSAIADFAYNDVLQVALESGWDNKIAYKSSGISQGGVAVNSAHERTGVNGGAFTCATYTLSPADTTTFPKTLTVDFGDQGCTSSDGITRKGKITYLLSGKLLSPGTTVSVTFTSYQVNGYQLEGTYSITNTSTLAGLSFVTSVTDGKITFPDAKWYTYAGSKTIRMIAGMLTPSNLTDDVYSIDGAHSFGSSEGNTLVDSISTSLHKAYACKFVQSGVITFTYNDTINGTLDFGTGDCDDTATIKIGEATGTVILQ